MEIGCCSPPIGRINDRVDKFTKIVTNFYILYSNLHNFLKSLLRERWKNFYTKTSDTKNYDSTFFSELLQWQSN